MEKQKEYYILVGRFLLGLYFIQNGIGHALTFEDRVAHAGSEAPIILSLVTDILFGLFIILGFKLRLAAYFLAGYLLIKTGVGHSDFSITTWAQIAAHQAEAAAAYGGDIEATPNWGIPYWRWLQFRFVFSKLAITGCCFLVIATHPIKWSLDAYFKK